MLAARPGLDIRCCPVADGGEGTLAAALSNGWEPRVITVTGPLGEPRTASLGLGTLDGAPAALVELALASGLALIPVDSSGQQATDPLAATSRGPASSSGPRWTPAAPPPSRSVSAAAKPRTDGGVGMLTALGATFLDAAGALVGPGGGVLASLAQVDLSGLDPRVGRTRFIVACDVDNELTGPRGAAAVFGPQKGATDAQVTVLDANLARLVDVLALTLGEAATAGAVRPGAGRPRGRVCRDDRLGRRASAWGGCGARPGRPGGAPGRRGPGDHR